MSCIYLSAVSPLLSHPWSINITLTCWSWKQIVNVMKESEILMCCRFHLEFITMASKMGFAELLLMLNSSYISQNVKSEVIIFPRSELNRLNHLFSSWIWPNLELFFSVLTTEFAAGINCPHDIILCKAPDSLWAFSTSCNYYFLSTRIVPNRPADTPH